MYENCELTLTVPWTGSMGTFTFLSGLTHEIDTNDLDLG